MEVQTLNTRTFQTLDYDKIIQQLYKYAMSYLGRAHIERLQPITDLSAIQRLLAEAEESKHIIMYGSSVPIPSLEGIESIMNILGKGYILSAQDFGHLA